MIREIYAVVFEGSQYKATCPASMCYLRAFDSGFDVRCPIGVFESNIIDFHG